MLCKLKGVSYYVEAIEKLKEGDAVILKIDEESEYDNKPIKCLGGGITPTNNDATIGFIGREQKEEVTKIISGNYKATVQKLHKWDGGPTGVVVKVE